jgi:hypothetical protein
MPKKSAEEQSAMESGAVPHAGEKKERKDKKRKAMDDDASEPAASSKEKENGKKKSTKKEDKAHKMAVSDDDDDDGEEVPKETVKKSKTAAKKKSKDAEEEEEEDDEKTLDLSQKMTFDDDVGRKKEKKAANPGKRIAPCGSDVLIRPCRLTVVSLLCLFCAGNGRVSVCRARLQMKRTRAATRRSSTLTCLLTSSRIWPSATSRTCFPSKPQRLKSSARARTSLDGYVPSAMRRVCWCAMSRATVMRICYPAHVACTSFSIFRQRRERARPSRSRCPSLKS